MLDLETELMRLSASELFICFIHRRYDEHCISHFLAFSVFVAVGQYIFSLSTEAPFCRLSVFIH